MSNKILVPTDGSPSATAAAEFASDLLAGGIVQSVTLLVVVSIAKAVKEEHIINPTQADEDMIRSKLRNAGQQIIDQTRSIFEQKGKTADDMLVMYDDPGEKIIEVAETNNYDLIIMGNRGRSLVKQLLMGSVSTKVLQNAGCPVIIYRK